MIKVLKYGNRKVVECKNCKSILEYTTEDVELDFSKPNDVHRKITCPVCNKSVRVNKP